MEGRNHWKIDMQSTRNQEDNKLELEQLTANLIENGYPFIPKEITGRSKKSSSELVDYWQKTHVNPNRRSF
jgi:hypothetical protein